jgi:hypothetical protein
MLISLRFMTKQVHINGIGGTITIGILLPPVDLVQVQAFVRVRSAKTKK